MMKCERCGKYRKDSDVLYIHHGDGFDSGEVLECRWCMAPVDAATLAPVGGDSGE